MKWSLKLSMRSLWRAEQGATALEFALVSPVLFLLVMGTVETALIYTAQNLLESATFSASRLGKTGRVNNASTQQQTIRVELERVAGALLDPKRIQITSFSYKDFNEVGQPEPFVDANNNKKRDNGENYTDINNNGQYDEDRGSTGYGKATEIVVYQVRYPWDLFTPLMAEFIGEDGTITLTSRAVVKNEPY